VGVVQLDIESELAPMVKLLLHSACDAKEFNRSGTTLSLRNKRFT
jgi:hypothetical protein